MRKWSWKMAAALAAAWLAHAPGAAAVPVGYSLVWADEFEGDALDASKWGHHQLGPRRSAINLAEAVRLDGAGHLVIDTWTGEDGVHHTGMINTRDRFEPTYGWFEARIELRDMAGGMWSAFWMQSRDMGSVIGDPGASGVEIDIQEGRAECGPGCDVRDVWQGSLYWDGYGADLKRMSSGRRIPGLGEGFHVFALEWTPTAYRFYVDGQLVWEPANPPISHRGEFVVLSSEVESVASFSGFIPEGGFGARGDGTPQMVVDYVRIYQVVPEPGSALLVATGLGAVALRRARRRDA
ncbi:MAG: glycoside hydrolase [Proteobacteria bacterium]|nr:MAG: glycoside hydrolase [Pseudomonadota bacterium]